MRHGIMIFREPCRKKPSPNNFIIHAGSTTVKQTLFDLQQQSTEITSHEVFNGIKGLKESALAVLAEILGTLDTFSQTDHFQQTDLPPGHNQLPPAMLIGRT